MKWKREQVSGYLIKIQEWIKTSTEIATKVVHEKEQGRSISDWPKPIADDLSEQVRILSPKRKL